VEAALSGSDREVEAKLRESRSFLDATWRLARVGGWRVDVENRELSWTDQTRRLHEAPPDYQPSLEQAIGFFHPEERPRVRTSIRRAMDRGESFDMEARLITAQGEQRWVRVVCEPRVVDGMAVELWGITQDISERKRMAEQMQQQDRLAALGQMAAGIAHDFLNRVNVILLFAQMGLRDPELTPGLAERLETIVSESNGIADLVQRIVDFSSRAMVDPQPTDLAVLAADTLDAIRPHLPAGVHVTFGKGPDEYIVKVDAGRIQQALTNLVHNARDAMPGGGEVRVLLSRLQATTTESLGFGQFGRPAEDIRNGDWVCLEVADTGTGMTEEVQSHLFEPFFTTQEVGKGTGLGLAQVYGIVRQHDGAIDVESTSGEGTTVRVCLPVYGERGAYEDIASLEAVDGRLRTLLVVEGDDLLRVTQRDVLESLGYRVLTARDAHQALAVGRSPRWSKEPGGRVDLLIAGLQVADTNGLNLVRELRRWHPTMGALLIAETMPHSYDPERLEAAGIEHVVERPSNLEALADIVRDILET
jgi:two-component system cell cycle sensor histidine kinase/response regulator CckA